MNFAFELVTLAPIQFYPKGEGGWVWEVMIGKNKIITVACSIEWFNRKNYIFVNIWLFLIN